MTPAPVLATACALAVAAPAMAQQGDARIAPEAYPHFRVMERALNQTGRFSSQFMFLDSCRFRHTYGRDLAPGTWIDRKTPIDFAQLDADALRVEDRFEGAVKMVIVPQDAQVGPVTHRLEMTDLDGTYHPSFLERYGGTCDDTSCEAELVNDAIYVAIVGAPGPADVDAVVDAMLGLATYCADAAEKG